MNIDYYKLVQLLLPVSLRKPVLVEFIRSLIWQVPALNSRFVLWAGNARYKANLNASVMALERLIQQEFDVPATIEELDGKPTDFLVNVSGSVDEVRLKALIGQYKLAGRSYTFRVGSAVYSCEFTNYACEDIREVFTLEFKEHYCEDDRNVYLSSVLMMIDAENLEISFQASHTVKSDLTIAGRIIAVNNNGHFVAGEFRANMANGNSSILIEVPVGIGSNYAIDSGFLTITPSGDSYFNYSYNQ